MIIGGNGISIFSEIAVRDLADEGKVLFVPLESEVKRTFYIIYLTSKKKTPVIKEFVDHIIQSYK
jgi:DNA-binding transcriptional LysR family regulator